MGKATVTRDPQGIAHIRTNNEPDLWFLQGYITASDRLFQMDYNRRLAEGTLAELVGAPALGNDVQLRTLGVDRAAQGMLAVISPQARSALEAYARGVNAWVSANPLPLEYGLLELSSFKPWDAQDCAAAGALLTFRLSFWLGELDRTTNLLTYVQTGLALGFDGAALYFEDVHRSAPFEPTASLPPAPDGGALSAKLQLPKLNLGLLRDYQDKIAAAPFLKRLRDEQRSFGSNAWVISGEHTTTGRPMLANDPHLGLETPSTLYPCHLRGGSFDVNGHSLPGMPFILQGHNSRIAWGSTSLNIDIHDWYQEQVVPDAASPSGLSTLYRGALEPILPIPESYAANQVGNGVLDDLVAVPPGGAIPPFTLIVPRRLNGPIVQLDLATGAALSLQHGLFAPGRQIDAFRGFNLAKNLAEFRSALKYFDLPASNFLFCDVAGNIAYLTGGEAPVREDLQAGTIVGLPPSFVRDGTGGNEWLAVQHPIPGQALPCEILPYDEMPHAINAAQGWLMNANNDPSGDTFDNDPFNRARVGGGIYYLDTVFDIGVRAGTIQAKISAKLAANEKFSVADMQALQADTDVGEARAFVPYLLGALNRAQLPGAHAQLAALAGDARVVEAVGRLAAWDFSAPTGIAEGYDAADVDGVLTPPDQAEIDASVACTLFYTWIGRTIEGTVEATLASVGLGENYWFPPLRHLLDSFAAQQGVGASGLDFFAMPGVTAAEDRRDIVLLRCMAESLDLLASPVFAPVFGGSTQQDDYRWGRLHRVTLPHPLGGALSIPPAGGAFPPPLAGLAGLPVDGGFNSVDVGWNVGRLNTPDGFQFNGGANHRTVYEAGVDRVRGFTALPGGTSGSVFSSNYFNLLPSWLTNESFPMLFTVSEIFQAAAAITKYVPGP
jgi:penicillin amidase